MLPIRDTHSKNHRPVEPKPLPPRQPAAQTAASSGEPRDTVSLSPRGQQPEMPMMRQRIRPEESGSWKQLLAGDPTRPEGESAQAGPGFTYTSVEPTNLTGAQRWTPGSPWLSPSDANQQINDDYHQISRGMQRYLAGDPSKEALPTLPDWSAFGKYASREAGEQIRNLENYQKAKAGDLKAAGDLARDGANFDSIMQALGMGTGAVIETADRPSWNGLTGKPAAVHAAQAVLNMDQKMAKLSKALVKGNTEIHKAVAPAYDTFLKGEASGEGGLKKLAEAGVVPGSDKDPQGFLTRAFESYQEARELGLAAQRTRNSDLKAELLEERRQLVEKGNLLLVTQEQMGVLQADDIYGDSDVQKALRSVSDQMSLTDANGKHSLGAPGKDWTRFADRMGLRTVAANTPGALEVRDSFQNVHHYLPDTSQPGTILEYFARHTRGDAESQALARNLIQNQARPTVQAPESLTGTVVDDLAGKAEWVKDTASWVLDLVA